MRQFSLLLAASVIGLSGSAHAQDARASDQNRSDDGSLMSDDIVVTAQKKTVGESAQKVPISVTALGAAQLETLNVRSLQDLAAFAPNATLDGNGTVRGYANFTIRGTGLNSSIPSLEPAVGLFVDGVYQGIPAGAVSDNFDLASIQILRGPQGTLFGRNVTGGAVLVDTVRPSGRFGGYLEATVETGPEYSIKGAIEAPIVLDLLSFRLAGYYRKDDGWFTNSFDGSKFGKQKTYIVRPTLLLTTGPIKQAVILEYGKVSGDSSAFQAFNNNRSDNFFIDINQPGAGNQRWYSATSETNADVAFGDGTITNILGYRNFRQFTSQDIDASALSLFHGTSLTHQDQVSDELRYAGHFGPVDITIGGFYLHQNLLYIEARNPYVAGNRGGGGRQNDDSYAAFGQASIDLTPKLSVIGGLRYSYEKKSAAILLLTPGRCLDVTQPCDFNSRPTVDSSRSWHNLSPKLGVDYKITDTVLVYASFGKGVRSGGYNLRLSGALDPGVFDQENATAYEVGLKSDLIGRTLRFNVAAFSNTFKGLQRTVTTFVGPAQVQTIDNSADARIRGVEADITMRPTQGLEFVFGVGYLDARYTAVRADLNGDKVVNRADLNLPLARVPAWNVSAGSIYTFEFGSGAKLQSQVFFAHRSKALAADDGSATYPEFNDLRADITFTLPNRKTSVSLYGRNIGNEAHNTTAYASVPAFPSRGYRVISEGRSLGIEVRQEF